MYTILIQSLPLIGLIALGFVAKQRGVLRPDDRHALARVVFSLTLPAVVFVSLSQAQVSMRTLGLLALCGAVIPLLLQFAAFGTVRALKQDRKTAGIVVMSSLSSTVMSFTAPFVLAIYGQAGLATVAAFDLGQSTVGSSYTYYVASRYASDGNWDGRTALRRMLASPMIWANAFGIVCNLTRWLPPQPIFRLIETVANANGALAMLMLGSFVELRFASWRPIVAAVAVRIGAGWMLGQLLVAMIGLHGLERTVVSVASAAPVGIMPLLYASLLGLDAELAASILSLSVLVASAGTPLLLWLHG